MSQRTLSSNAVKAPVRPAPPPPSNIAKVNTFHVQHAAAASSSRAPPRPSSEPGKKKIAPPRPPPPKASAQLKAVQNAVAFAGMISQPRKQAQLPLTSSVTAPDLLINWDSPPTSPTPGRSSSDCLSLKSFGSDSSGTQGAFSTMTRSESGFESEPDAWSETAVTLAAPVRNENVKPFTMPTIIRPNRSRPPPPAIKSSTHLKVLEKMTSSIPSAAAPLPLPRSSSPYLADLLDLDVTVGADDYSPPEPCIPPPAPPSFLLVSSLSAAVAAAAPTLTSSSPPPSLELGVGPDAGSAVALFDYQSSHPGDLNFKEGERIVVLSQVNEEWCKGSIGSSQGMFPLSYVRLDAPPTPVETSRDAPPSSSNRAVALYAFEAETDHDLSLKEGDIVRVIESVGNGWLYGEDCQSGRRGQFPESFVRRELN
ncbi:uncharacterized protein B0303.7-like isoform X2 [Daphnia pulicaria]|uniref:uncharacterized protein B0303.7-like isoform X2 n=1 Tax=Daphnia pulicaria TaxID=35523 RepID=UPI001EE9BE88|nr:uncharacterized protein B0303.7-like isoform X2 [Daphnia pulicaria]